MELLFIVVGSLLLIALANKAELDKRWRPLVLATLIVVNLMIGSLGTLLWLSRWFDRSIPESTSPPLSVSWIMLAVAVVGIILLLPPVRRALSRLLPLQPDSAVHLTAIQLSLYMVAWSAVNLVWLGGVEGLQAAAEDVPVYLYVLQAAGMVIVALAGVGLFVRRSWSEVWARLGLDSFQWPHLLVVGLAVLALMTLNFVVSYIWILLDPEQMASISEISNALLGNFDSLGGIFLLAVLSGVSEEVLFRGALQPRLGIVLSSLVFASTHIQYALSPATLTVLGIGLALGYLRRYLNTWSAILTHFGYNFGLLMLGYLAPRVLEMLK